MLKRDATNNNASTWRYNYSTGTAFTSNTTFTFSHQPAANGYWGDLINIADVNGDGLGDIVHIGKNNASGSATFVDAYLSKGNGFVTVANSVLSNKPFNHRNAEAVHDNDGDGRADFVLNNIAASPAMKLYIKKEGQEN